MKHIRTRLTYANVMSSIAVFLMLGGATAVAATKIGANEIKANSIKTGKIVKEAVTAGKLKKGSVSESKLAKDAVTSEKVKDGSLTGSDINASTLGTVPNADKLDGTPASGYAKSQLPNPIFPTLLGSWKNDPERQPASFYKDPFGIVHLEGTIEGGPTFSNIFTLPSGYRPGAEGANFLIYSSSTTPGGLFIGSEGRVTFLEGNIGLVSLYGVTFKAVN